MKLLKLYSDPSGANFMRSVLEVIWKTNPTFEMVTYRTRQSSNFLNICYERS